VWDFSTVSCFFRASPADRRPCSVWVNLAVRPHFGGSSRPAKGSKIDPILHCCWLPIPSCRIFRRHPSNSPPVFVLSLLPPLNVQSSFSDILHISHISI
jgi:hypothetical protein